MTCVRFGVAAALTILSLVWPSAQPASTQSPGLKIVVVEGEDAVNIIQQKTAVAPVVEVRDRNDQPVAGAIVNFAIRGGRATFGGARTLTVATDVAGRAVAAGLTPTANGALQISASAAFQGQTAAAVTIAQTNVMTAAQAAAVSGAAGSGGGTATGTSAGAAGGGGGGGLSATTIGLVGGAIAGGTVVATQVLDDKGSGGKTFTGTYTGEIRMTAFSASGAPACGFIESLNGTVTVELNDATTGAGTAEVKESHTITSGNCGNLGRGATDETASGPLSGPPSALTFAFQKTNPLPNNGLRTKPWSFSGQFNGSEIVGVLTTGDTNAAANGVVTATGSSSIPVTLR